MWQIVLMYPPRLQIANEGVSLIKMPPSLNENILNFIVSHDKRICNALNSTHECVTLKKYFKILREKLLEEEIHPSLPRPDEY